jgi:predicted HTH transcriptional regulator
MDGKDVAVVRVKPSPHEVFLKIEGKEKFYIRSGNTSQELDISEATQYIKEQWPRYLAPQSIDKSFSNYLSKLS